MTEMWRTVPKSIEIIKRENCVYFLGGLLKIANSIKYLMTDKWCGCYTHNCLSTWNGLSIVRWLWTVNVFISLALALLTEVKPQFVWDLSASARWASTPLSLKRHIWLCVWDVGSPHSQSQWMLPDCLMTVYWYHKLLFWGFFCVTNLLRSQASVLISLDTICFFVVVIKYGCWMFLVPVLTSVRDWRRTRHQLRCRLTCTMLPRCAVSVCHVLMLVLCLSAAEDFDWTKNNHGAFYYGTFPAGMQN